MSIIQESKNVLVEAESSLRKLIEKGLKEQRYADIAEVANMADGVSRLLRLGDMNKPSLSKSVESRSPARAKRKINVGSPLKKRSRPKKSNYPHFGCDGGRLVKVGWSKKNKKEYEHRVSKEAVIAFIRHLVNNVREGEIFEIENLLPVEDISGDEIPAYQIYVILAWLRTTNSVEKKGRDGYVLRDTSLVDDGLDKLWETLPARPI